MPRLFRDLFTQWLEAECTKPGIYQPGGILGGPPLGWQLTVGSSTIAYRVEKAAPETLIVVMIERSAERKGLRSPWADLVRFLALVQRSKTGIKEVRGKIAAVSWRPKDSLENDRMWPFYQRYLGGRQLPMENDAEWVTGQLENLVMPLSEHRHRPPPD